MQEEVRAEGAVLSVRIARVAAGLALALAPGFAHASFLSGDALDTVANWLAWFIIIVMPVAGVVVFLMVHVLPEKIAEKKQHPHKHSIKTLCILSLVFGGMLWPFAWLWAYTRPLGFKAVYGTEKHEDYYLEMAKKVHAGELSAEELAYLRHELEVMDSHSPLDIPLQRLLDELKHMGVAPSAAAPASAAAQAARRTEAAHGD
jgi:CBS domain containing-hemolysin-like protein